LKALDAILSLDKLFVVASLPYFHTTTNGGKSMQLLPDDVRAGLPALYAQEKENDPMVHLKYFTPDSNWTWYVTEGQQNGDDFLFFGHVCGTFAEWGYFTLSELESARGSFGLPIERDLDFTPARWSDVKTLHEQTHGTLQ